MNQTIYKYEFITFQGISGEAKLADNISGNVCLNALAHFSLTLSSLQTLVKLLWIKLLDQRKDKCVEVDSVLLLADCNKHNVLRRKILLCSESYIWGHLRNCEMGLTVRNRTTNIQKHPPVERGKTATVVLPQVETITTAYHQYM